LIDANLISADLSGAVLISANLNRANLSCATVAKASFSYNLGISEPMKLDLRRRGAIVDGLTDASDRNPTR
jgi:uncharacterized protein YjbI with pentapeptide repeats